MTTLTPKTLYSGGQLSNAAGVLYTCPANTKAVISAMTVSNTDTANQNVTVYIVRSGGTATAANVAIDDIPLAPKQSYQCPEMIQQQLGAGDTIQAYSSTAANKITCAGISGYELTP